MLAYVSHDLPPNNLNDMIPRLELHKFCTCLYTSTFPRYAWIVIFLVVVVVTIGRVLSDGYEIILQHQSDVA